MMLQKLTGDRKCDSIYEYKPNMSLFDFTTKTPAAELTIPELVQLLFHDEWDIRAMIEMTTELGNPDSILEVLRDVYEWLTSGLLNEEHIEKLKANFREGIKNMVNRLAIEMTQLEAANAESQERKVELSNLNLTF